MAQKNICPLCTSTHTSFLYSSYNRHGRHIIDKHDRFKIHRCNNCDVLFLTGVRVDLAYYEKYYETGYYDGGLSQNKNLVVRIVQKLEEWSLKKKEQFILRNAPQKRPLKILDVGCGHGKFLESLDARVFEKYGVEINQEGAELSRKKGLTIYDRDVTEIDFKGKKFDVITLWHVLEHLTDTVGVYNKLNEILSDDGILLFATPNTDSFGSRIGKPIWFHLDSPRHLILFNRKSADYLCEQTGFKITATINEFYDYPLDLFWSIQQSPLKFLMYPTYPLWKFLDREALTAICKKM